MLHYFKKIQKFALFFICADFFFFALIFFVLFWCAEQSAQKMRWGFSEHQRQSAKISEHNFQYFSLFFFKIFEFWQRKCEKMMILKKWNLRFFVWVFEFKLDLQRFFKIVCFNSIVFRKGEKWKKEKNVTF